MSHILSVTLSRFNVGIGHGQKREWEVGNKSPYLVLTPECQEQECLCEVHKLIIMYTRKLCQIYSSKVYRVDKESEPRIQLGVDAEARNMN